MLAFWQTTDDIKAFKSGVGPFYHFYSILTDSDGFCSEGWPTLTALTQATTLLRLGYTGHWNSLLPPRSVSPYRLPHQTLSPSERLELEIGASRNEQESDAYEIA